MSKLIATIALGAFAGCTLAPSYERPKSPVENQFPGGTGAGLAAADRGWRDVFGDPRLQAVIGLALRNNRDLRVAMLNVELTQAQYRIQRSELFPTVGAAGTAEYSGTTDDFNKQYRVGVGVTAYELDLFGRVRSLKDAALEEYLAARETQRAAHLSLVAEVVQQYLRERAYDEQRQIAERTVELVRESLGLTTRLLEAGQRSDLDVRTAEAQLYGAQAEVIRLTRLRAQAENALVLLVGQPLGDLPAPQPLESQAIVADLPAGLPSDLLQRRPDILAAEHILRSANANIGAARAAFFPSISLTGFAGLISTSLSGLFSGGVAWAFAPQISVPLFTGGRNQATLDVAKVRKRIEVARYERAIQVAFREVADALIARATFDDQLAAQIKRFEAETKRFEISEARYRNGIENYLSVIQAQRDLYLTEQQVIELRFQKLTNLADLYAALGGGWRES